MEQPAENHPRHPSTGLAFATPIVLSGYAGIPAYPSFDPYKLFLISNLRAHWIDRCAPHLWLRSDRFCFSPHTVQVCMLKRYLEIELGVGAFTIMIALFTTGLLPGFLRARSQCR
jgi:hypothetical protein